MVGDIRGLHGAHTENIHDHISRCVDESQVMLGMTNGPTCQAYALNPLLAHCIHAWP